MTTAPIAHAPLYQPAAIPTCVAFSATPTVEAAPTARPVTLKAISDVDNFLPANKYSIGFLLARFFT